MLPFDALKDMRVMIATPCYAQSCGNIYVASMFSLAGDCQKAGLETRLELHSESLITRSRNKLSAMFLKEPKWTHLFFLDADMMFNSTAVFRLLLSDLDLVAGVPPIKQFNLPEGGIPKGMTWTEMEDRYGIYPFMPIAEQADPDGFCEVVAATTGFMCIKRKVFDVIMKHYPELKYVPDGKPGNPDEPYYWDFFGCLRDEGNRILSEDYSFCKLFRGAGGKVHVDIDSRIGHLGQHVWRGDLLANLKAKHEARLRAVA